MSEVSRSTVPKQYDDLKEHLEQECKFYKWYVRITLYFMSAVIIVLLLLVFVIIYFLRNTSFSMAGLTASIPTLISSLIGGGGISGFGGLLFRLHKDAKNRLNQTNQDLYFYDLFIESIHKTDDTIDRLEDKSRKDEARLRLIDYVQAGPQRKGVSIETPSPKKGTDNIINFSRNIES